MPLRLTDLIKVLPQYLIPKHWLSQGMHAFMRIRVRWVKLATMKLMVRLYHIDLSEAEETVLDNYPHFNALFTRALKPEARPVDSTPDSWCSPVDGVVSQSARIQGDTLIQAKCHDYHLPALLGGDIHYAQQFENGDYAVIYLAPRDYHRIHMPKAGRLVSMTYVPGDLFAVNPATVRQIEGLFARNERVICRFETPDGPFCMIWVGAIFVGSMETVWQGKVTPPYGTMIEHWDYRDQSLNFEKGEELGRFNMGSTVILLSPEGQCPDLGKQTSDRRVKMGERLTQSADPAESMPRPASDDSDDGQADHSPKITL
ncbi:MAG: archaetidylserine decarboxylase [Hydrogenovibrio sp.]|uniref:archaetidylserine decarboxylase n=1 Tax=Hydrogenovibrio sp. TaxID=2065821 RepID=UPI00287092FC|nr:archaetidylserine decarboxylase [Hydrogenovibrio sp.]MDR9498624.1 archaetidylserine decarboxylase [Hydrogenovibrio sp.]